MYDKYTFVREDTQYSRVLFLDYTYPRSFLTGNSFLVLEYERRVRGLEYLAFKYCRIYSIDVEINYLLCHEC